MAIHPSIIILFFIPTVIKCTNIEARDEKTYPNGTLVGAYSYLDSQGNKVYVKYFADRDSYSVELRGYRIPEDETATRESSSVTRDPATVLMETLVPLKFEIPEIENMYTVENSKNASNDITKKKTWPETEDQDDQTPDYAIFNSAPAAAKPKVYEKENNRGYKNFIRKIRQSLDNYSAKTPTS